MKKKIPYDEIKLDSKVKFPNNDALIGTIVSIENFASLAGISEPIFCVKFPDCRIHFGLKYITKNLITI